MTPRHVLRDADMTMVDEETGRVMKRPARSRTFQGLGIDHTKDGEERETHSCPMPPCARRCSRGVAITGVATVIGSDPLELYCGGGTFTAALAGTSRG